jgi:hypothetical protein
MSGDSMIANKIAKIKSLCNNSNKTYIHNFVIWGFDEAIFIIKLTNIQ